MARGLSSSLRSTLVLMPLPAGTLLVHSPTSCRPPSASHAFLSSLTPGLITSPLRRPHSETFPPLPSVTLTPLCAMSISAFLPITRGSRASVVCSGCSPEWSSRCVARFFQDTSGTSWSIFSSTGTQRKQRRRRKKRLWLLRTTAQLQNILPQGLTTGVASGELVRLQLHLLAFRLLVQTGLLLQLLLPMVCGMQLRLLQQQPRDGNKPLPLSRHLLLTGSKSVSEHGCRLYFSHQQNLLVDTAGVRSRFELFTW